MPRYLSRGLLVVFLILTILIGVGIGRGAFVSVNLENTVSAAIQQGQEAGYSKGHQDGLVQGNEAGYQEGSKFGYIFSGGPASTQLGRKGDYFLYNPTFNEMMSMLNSNELYSAKDILDYARANGIRAAYVRVPIARPANEGRVYLFQLVAFETVDKGLVIIEPLSHRPVKLEVRKSYSQLNDFPVSAFDDTITEVTVVW